MRPQHSAIDAHTRRHAMDQLVDSLDNAGPTDSAQQIADTAVRELARLLDVEMAKFLTLDASGAFLVMAAGVGWNSTGVGPERVPAQVTSQAGYALTVDGPIFFENILNTKRFSDADVLRHAGVVSSLVMALRQQQRVLGVLGVHSRVRRSFTADDMDALEHVGRALARALERVGCRGIDDTPRSTKTVRANASVPIADE